MCCIRKSKCHMTNCSVAVSSSSQCNLMELQTRLCKHCCVGLLSAAHTSRHNDATTMLFATAGYLTVDFIYEHALFKSAQCITNTLLNVWCAQESSGFIFKTVMNILNLCLSPSLSACVPVCLLCFVVFCFIFVFVSVLFCLFFQCCVYLKEVYLQTNL